jgi:glycosyltransferase involved in cell wall biosynthesis
MTSQINQTVFKNDKNPIIFLMSGNDIGGVTKITLNICKELQKMNIPCEIHVPFFTHFYYTKTLRAQKNLTDVKLWTRYLLGQIRLEVKQRRLKFCGERLLITDAKIVRYIFNPNLKRLMRSKFIVIQQSTLLQQLGDLGITENKILIAIHHLFTNNPADLESKNSKHPVIKIASSLFTSSEILQIGVNDSSLVHLGVDLDTFNPKNRTIGNQTEIHIGFYFHPHQRKNPILVESLVEYFVELNKNNIFIHVFGNSFNKKKANNHVIVNENITEYEYARKIANLDLFIFASKMEGFGLPPLEAMASGVPVIASSVGAVPEYMNSDCGVILDNEFSKEVWIQEITKLVENSKERTRLALNARLAAEKYSWEKTTFKYLELFSQLN